MSTDEYPIIEETDDGLIYVANGPDDYDFDPRDNHYTDGQGVKHIWVRDGNVAMRYSYDPKTKRLTSQQVF